MISFKDWLRDLLLWIPKKVWEGILDAVAAVLEAIPVPAFLDDIAGLWAAIPSEVVFFAEALELPVGIGMVIAAYTGRFLIRRIPVIG